MADALDIGEVGVQYLSEGNYVLALEKFQSSLRVLVPLLSKEPLGHRRDLLHEQVSLLFIFFFFFLFLSLCFFYFYSVKVHKIIQVESLLHTFDDVPKVLRRYYKFDYYYYYSKLS